MDRWEDTIRVAIAKAELSKGYTPTHVIVRPEVWSELADDIYADLLVDVVYVDTLQVSVANIEPPFILTVSMEQLDEG